MFIQIFIYRIPSLSNRGTELPCEQGIWWSYVWFCLSVIFVREFCPGDSESAHAASSQWIVTGGTSQRWKMEEVWRLWQFWWLWSMAKHGEGKTWKDNVSHFKHVQTHAAHEEHTQQERIVLHRQKGRLVICYIYIIYIYIYISIYRYLEDTEASSLQPTLEAR